MISRIRYPQLHMISGKVRCGKLTKHLIPFLCPGEIAIIDHQNLDSVAANGLIERKVKAIINCSSSFTGQYVTYGAKAILDQGIPLFDFIGPIDLFSQVKVGEKLMIADGFLLFNQNGERLDGMLHQVTEGKWVELITKAQGKMPEVFSEFIDNTLGFILHEKSAFLQGLPPIPIQTKMDGRPVVVVIRGKHYKEDLTSILPFIKKENPVLLGVDGGADAFLELDLVPDIIVGDMDSVSREALRQATDVIVHAFQGGFAPGEKRVRGYGIPYYLLPAPGVSEDVAMLLAYEHRARLIVGIGYHSCMLDFLEKGRKGMGSTLLVRMKIDDRFIDARGINQLGLDVKENGYQHYYSRLQ